MPQDVFDVQARLRRSKLAGWPAAITSVIALMVGLVAAVHGLQSNSSDGSRRSTHLAAAPTHLLLTPVVDVPAPPAAADVSVIAEDIQPGLAVTFSRPGAPLTDTRHARLVSLYVPQGAAPTPFLEPGPFVAIWEGDLTLRLRDTYAFSAQGRGKLTVTINDKPALETSGDDFLKMPGEPIRLNKGKNHVIAKYESPASGDAQVRLMWTMKDELLPEPVRPEAWTYNAAAAKSVEGKRLRDGRFLLAQLRCTACHAAPGNAAPGTVMPAAPGHSDPAAAGQPGPMPELAMDSPSLTDAGARLNREWIAAWVNDPHALRPDAHMPRVFHDGTTDVRAADVAAYLASLGGDAPEPAMTGKPEIGGQLFTSLNCLACHERPGGDPTPAVKSEPKLDGAGDAGAPDAKPPEDPAVLARVSLRYVKAKYKPRALIQFLLDPHANYVWRPMPNFKLSADEAESLAAFLLSKSTDKLPGDLAAGDATKGKQLVGSSGCLNCHTIGDSKGTFKAPTLAELSKDGWAKGTAKDRDFHTAGPQYTLSEDQRTALAAFAATDRTSLNRDAMPEFAERQIIAMRCTACHMRDGKESLLATAYDDDQKALESKYAPPQAAGTGIFAPDQRAPMLTWAGEKLRPQWSGQLISGQLSYKPRPYIRAKMPAFTVRAAGLAAGLAEEHGYPPISPEPPNPDPALAAAGRKLCGKTPNEAFACLNCHAIGKMPPLAPFEAPAVNFAYARDRLEKEYYHRWVHNPLRIDPNTKMPAFEREDGKTTITTSFDGDARKQFEAVWQYLLTGSLMQPPED